MRIFVGFDVFVLLVGVGLSSLGAGDLVPQAVTIVLSSGLSLGVWEAQKNAKHAQALEEKLASGIQVFYKPCLNASR